VVIKLIASDLDGTIANEANEITPSNFDAMKKINNKNINFAISTGKPYAISKKICNNCNANYGIFGNGTQIVDLKNGKEIAKTTISKEDLLFCVGVAKKYNLHMHLYTDNRIVTEKLEYMDLRNYLLNKEPSDLEFKMTKNIKSYVEHTKENIFKFVISSEYNLSSVKEEILENANLDILHIKKYGKTKDTVINKEYEYLDITPKNISKGEALKVLGNYLQINSKEIMAIGDNINDISMVQEAGIGVAVANAYDSLKQIATYTTARTVEEGGFAEAIEKYIV